MLVVVATETSRKNKRGIKHPFFTSKLFMSTNYLPNMEMHQNPPIKSFTTKSNCVSSQCKHRLI